MKVRSFGEGYSFLKLNFKNHIDLVIVYDKVKISTSDEIGVYF